MSQPTEGQPMVLQEDRFARHQSIKWWDQQALTNARVLVIGAGALGNEVIKNLALLGVGHLAIADMDKIEASNLSRSVLFRESDEGHLKTVTAAKAALALYPTLNVHVIDGNVLSDLGLGWFRWAQVIVGALDNREARLFVNQCCIQTQKPWVDGGLDVLNGIVRGFDAPRTPCYECTMGNADWQLVNQRRSCSLLARQAFDAGGVPTTITTASVIGAMQAQEVIKRLHQLDCLDGSGFVYEGLRHTSYPIQYTQGKNCPWHEESTSIQSVNTFDSDTPLDQIAQWATEKLHGLDAIDLSRELVQTLTCPKCQNEREIFMPVDRLKTSTLVCETCQEECVPAFVHSIMPDSPLMQRTAKALGLPAWDVLWARRGMDGLGIELSGDQEKQLQTSQIHASNPEG
ncbi:MAG: molybdopterin biosynthesis protein MoeB [Phycisphaeraceae bacterium]|nr:molybdopterin biosynthesis protein MoeB [Phycisphaeraceae bacterium]